MARSDTLYAAAIAAIAAVFPVVLEMAVEEVHMNRCRSFPQCCFQLQFTGLTTCCGMVQDVNRIVVAMSAKRTGISSGKTQPLSPRCLSRLGNLVLILQTRPSVLTICCRVLQHQPV